ncbi:hypothetical protein ACRAWD_09335 [Caulobacter segnis]
MQPIVLQGVALAQTLDDRIDVDADPGPGGGGPEPIPGSQAWLAKFPVPGA